MFTYLDARLHSAVSVSKILDSSQSFNLLRVSRSYHCLAIHADGCEWDNTLWLSHYRKYARLPGFHSAKGKLIPKYVFSKYFFPISLFSRTISSPRQYYPMLLALFWLWSSSFLRKTWKISFWNSCKKERNMLLILNFRIHFMFFFTNSAFLYIRNILHHFIESNIVFPFIFR
jgi:hypothetical protein